ncbi:hypothetical protein TRFO_22136 [Tritrichomonas foetus]|uniref:Uncharacterized protein n=1 Tax=Tritrichomonas foetus TaxID=1144522 RepID=A0A1J4KH18_9EUKA|nr:hypothetical protein TRFO_22136 [Tritrichomonas foetus]|eukprot:OHT09124.1 hypothetical protein TRFO_22136 [Tritrichomonas foetus]
MKKQIKASIISLMPQFNGMPRNQKTRNICLVDAQWFADLKEWVDSDDNTPLHKINNEDLSKKLKNGANVEEIADYELVEMNVYDALVKVFGGGPAIIRPYMAHPVTKIPCVVISPIKFNINIEGNVLTRTGNPDWTVRDFLISLADKIKVQASEQRLKGADESHFLDDNMKLREVYDTVGSDLVLEMNLNVLFNHSLILPRAFSDIARNVSTGAASTSSLRLDLHTLKSVDSQSHRSQGTVVYSFLNSILFSIVKLPQFTKLIQSYYDAISGQQSLESNLVPRSSSDLTLNMNHQDPPTISCQQKNDNQDCSSNDDEDDVKSESESAKSKSSSRSNSKSNSSKSNHSTNSDSRYHEGCQQYNSTSSILTFDHENFIERPDTLITLLNDYINESNQFQNSLLTPSVYAARFFRIVPEVASNPRLFDPSLVISSIVSRLSKETNSDLSSSFVVQILREVSCSKCNCKETFIENVTCLRFESFPSKIFKKTNLMDCFDPYLESFKKSPKCKNCRKSSNIRESVKIANASEFLIINIARNVSSGEISPRSNRKAVEVNYPLNLSLNKVKGKNVKLNYKLIEVISQANIKSSKSRVMIKLDQEDNWMFYNETKAVLSNSKAALVPGSAAVLFYQKV